MNGPEPFTTKSEALLNEVEILIQNQLNEIKNGLNQQPSNLPSIEAIYKKLQLDTLPSDKQKNQVQVATSWFKKSTA